MEMSHVGNTHCQFNRWNSQVFFNIKKYKIVFKIKEFLRITFLRLFKTPVLSRFISMQNLNNNWFILDSLGNIYEVHANLNHF